MGTADVIGRGSRSASRMPGAKWVEPGMQFQTTFVGLFHRESQWIIERSRGFAHGSREVLRPRLQTRRVEGITGRPNLKDHGVKFELGGAIQQRCQFGFLLSGV